MRVAAIIAAIAASSFVACGENIDARYRTYAELQQADAGARSWIPPWLPSSATDIRDWHNLDTNATLIAFTVPQATPALLSDCRASRIAWNPGVSSEWWPKDRAFMTLEHFRCEERMTFGDGHVEVRETGAAIDRRNNRIYFWRSGR